MRMNVFGLLARVAVAVERRWTRALQRERQTSRFRMTRAERRRQAESNRLLGLRLIAECPRCSRLMNQVGLPTPAREIDDALPARTARG